MTGIRPAAGARGGAPAWAVAAGCALAALALYAPSLGHGLVWDDPILRDYVLGLDRRGGLRAVLAAEFRVDEAMGYYRPLVLLSFLADERLTALFGPSHHATNLLLHAGTTAAVALLAQAWAGSAAAALCAGLLFAAHPVHVESVAFVSGRTDLMAGLFAVLAALAWERGRARDGTAARAAFAAHLALFALACLSKEVAFLLPAALLGADLCLGRGGERGAAAFLRRNLPWLAGWAAVLAAVFVLRAAVAGVGLGAGADLSAPGTLAAASPLRLALLRWVRYLGLLGAPWPLSAWYGPDQLEPTAAALAGVAVLAALGAAAWRLGAGRLFLLGAGWTVVFLVPVSGVVRLSAAAMAERFLYLPSAGLCLAAGAVTAAAAGEARGRAARGGLAGAWVVGLGLCAAAVLARTPVWRDDLALALDIEATAPASDKGFVRHAILAAQAGRYAEAQAAVQEALRRNPASVDSWMLAAILAGKSGRIDEEIGIYRRILALSPGNRRAAYNLAMALLDRGRRREATEQLRTTVAAHPDFEEAATALARILAQGGARPDER